jgi:hypothetical protein
MSSQYWYQGMYTIKKIFRIPLNNILAPGFKFRWERKRNGVQLLLEGKPIWDFPYGFMEENYEGVPLKYDMLWNRPIVALYRFLRLYYDTPRDKLEDIQEDFFQLRDILLAADKRRGRFSNNVLAFRTNSGVARQIIHYRFGRKHREA